MTRLRSIALILVIPILLVDAKIFIVLSHGWPTYVAQTKSGLQISRVPFTWLDVVVAALVLALHLMLVVLVFRRERVS